MKLGQNTQRNSVPSREKELEVLVVTIRPGSARLTGVWSALLTHRPGRTFLKIHFVVVLNIFSRTKHCSKHVKEDCVANIESKQDLPSNELVDGVEDDLQQGHDDELQHGHLENIYIFRKKVFPSIWKIMNDKRGSYTMVFFSL